MQNPSGKEIVELLALASDVKQRLRRIETEVSVHGNDSISGEFEAGAISRVRNHLELALEALGAPTWGFASSTAGSMQITGFYSSDIYKALKDIRETSGKGKDAPDTKRKSERRKGQRTGRRQADWRANDHASRSKRTSAADDEAQNPAAAPSPAGQIEQPATAGNGAAAAATAPATEAAGDSSSVWVKSRVDEIQRALTAAFGDDELLPDLEAVPKPFATPEFIGNTDTLSVPELVGFFQLQGKTGVLTVDARQEQFKLEYLRGELIHAASSSSPAGERLGDILVALGHLTPELLASLLADKSAAERLGDAIRRGEVVSEEALAQALQVQVQNIFHRLFDLGGCRFTFREGLEGEPRARVRYNVTRLLLETARHRDEQRQAG